MSDFKYTTAIKKIRAMDKRIKVVQGGTSSGKTFAIIPILIDRACKEDRLKITVVAETLPSVKEGAMDIFKTIMTDTHRWIDKNWNASSLTYTFSGTKSRIQFKSYDTEGKAKASGKREILFLNEANHIAYQIADALMIRSKETYIDFNPDNEFWVHTEVLKQPNAEFLLLTYHDNEGLPDETLEDLLIKKSKAFFNPNIPDENLFNNGNVKSEYWANWWRVYGLGEIGSLEGVIFNNWKIIDDLPNEAKYIRSGLDFGFTNDPTALIDKYEYNSIPIYDEVIYEKELTNSQIANKTKADGMSRFIIADSAEPKSIAELKRLGLKIDGADKGKDSINFGIQQLQKYDLFYVTARSLNLINELRKYKWMVDKTGNKLNIPIDDFNHCFVGNTLVHTIEWQKPIKDIKEGDLILTRNGYKECLKKFNNGVKKVSKYLMQFDTFSLSLSCTDNHLIYTDKGWIEISKLKKGMTVDYIKLLEDKNISYTLQNNISQEANGIKELPECTSKYGNSTTVKFQRDSKYITKTKTSGTTKLRTLNVYRLKSITKSIKKSSLKELIAPSKLNILKKLDRLQKSGTLQKKVENGTQSTLKKIILDNLICQKRNANNVSQNLSQKNITVNSAQTTVNRNIEGCQELMTSQGNVLFVNQSLQQTNIQKLKLVDVNVVERWEEEVFDIMVDEEHEYFANGLLVHNCIDPMRYIETYGMTRVRTKLKSSAVW